MKFNFPPCPLPDPARTWAFLYFRDSGGDSQDTSSQKAYGLAYCKHYAINVAAIFVDAAATGGGVAHRQEFQRMIDAAGNPLYEHVTAVLYWDIKRLARNQEDADYYMAKLRRMGYTLVSLSDNIIPGEFQFVQEAFLKWKAEKDRQDISKDAKRGLDFLVNLRDPDTGQYLGVFPQQKPPTFFRITEIGPDAEVWHKLDALVGLRHNNGQPRILRCMEPDPQIWEKGKKVMAMRAERASYKRIERELRVFPHSVNPNSTYTSIFRNEIYIGKFGWGGQVYEDYVPKLATDEQWVAIQALRRKQSPQQHPRRVSSNYLLSGLCFCDDCQSRMNGGINTRKGRNRPWRYYRCTRKQYYPEQCQSSHVSAERLEQATISVVCSRVLTVDFVGRLAERVNQLLADTGNVQTQLAAARKQESDLVQAIENLLDMVEVGSTAVARRLTQREVELKAIRVEIEQLKLQAAQTGRVVDEKTVVDLLTNWRQSLQSGHIDAGRTILRRCVEKIEVGREFARLYYTFPVEVLGGGGLWTMPPTGFEPVSPP